MRMYFILVLLLLGAVPASALQIGDGQYAKTYNAQNLSTAQARFNGITTKGAGGGVPVGSIIAWPVATNPEDMENWLECNGQAISASAYPELRSLVGPNVPDLRGRVLQERDATHAVGEQIAVGLPNITGRFVGFSDTYGGRFPTQSDGAFYGIYGGGSVRAENSTYYNSRLLGFDASRSNSIFGSSNTVQPPAYAVRYLIRALP